MKLVLRNLINYFLAFALIMVPFQSGQASMIVADQVNTAVSAQADRISLSNLLNRAETRSEFQSLGLDAKATTERLAAMTDDEVHTLAGQVNAVPAGGDGLVALILVVFFIWYFAFRR